MSVVLVINQSRANCWSQRLCHTWWYTSMIQSMCVYKTSVLALGLKPYLHFYRKRSLHAFTQLLLQYDSFFPRKPPWGDSRRRVQLVEIGPLFLMTLVVIIMIGDDQHYDAKTNPAGWSALHPLSHLTPEDMSGLDPRCPCCWGHRCCCCLSDGCQAAGDLLIKTGRGNHRLVLTRRCQEGEMGERGTVGGRRGGSDEWKPTGEYESASTCNSSSTTRKIHLNCICITNWSDSNQIWWVNQTESDLEHVQSFGYANAVRTVRSEFMFWS